MNEEFEKEYTLSAFWILGAAFCVHFYGPPLILFSEDRTYFLEACAALSVVWIAYVAFGTLYFGRNRGKTRGAWIVSAVVAGAVILASPELYLHLNCWLDFSESRKFVGIVERESTWFLEPAREMYKLKVRSCDPGEKSVEMLASEVTVKQFPKGQAIVAEKHSGAFYIPWFSLARTGGSECPKAEADTFVPVEAEEN